MVTNSTSEQVDMRISQSTQYSMLTVISGVRDLRLLGEMSLLGPGFTPKKCLHFLTIPFLADHESGTDKESLCGQP